MKGTIVGYDGSSMEIIVKLSTMEDNDCIPLNKEVEIVVVE